MTAQPLVEVTIEVPAVPEELGALHDALDRFWAEIDRALPAPPEQEWRLLFATALGEAGANVVRHAYRGGSTQGAMRLELIAFPDRVEARLIDRGVELAGGLPPISAAPEADELAEHGYGLALIRAAVDELRYERVPGSPKDENRWLLVKRLPTPTAPP
jgi:anti-sigma regulatory factor (Ser/Thr protein kinase)